MTEQKIQDRITELTNQAKQMEVNLIAIQGAIQNCQWMLTQFPETTNAVEEVNLA